MPKLALGLTQSPNTPAKATRSRNRSTTATGAELKNAWSYRPTSTTPSAPMLVISTDIKTDVFIIRPIQFPNDTVFISDAYTNNKLVMKLLFFWGGRGQQQFYSVQDPGDSDSDRINPLNLELNPMCSLLALLGAHYFLHVSRIRVK